MFIRHHNPFALASKKAIHFGQAKERRITDQQAITSIEDAFLKAEAEERIVTKNEMRYTPKAATVSPKPVTTINGQDLLSITPDEFSDMLSDWHSLKEGAVTAKKQWKRLSALKGQTPEVLARKEDMNTSASGLTRFAKLIRSTIDSLPLPRIKGQKSVSEDSANN